jgi:cell wall-associated NlpC family hydrolase
MQPIHRCLALLLPVCVLIWGATGCSSLPDRPTAAELRPDAAARRAVTASAREMLGRPYRFGGSNPRGFDCSGLAWYAHRRAGILLPRTARGQRAASTPVPVGALIRGDLLFFHIDESRSEHVGIYLGEGDFIHAPSAGKRVTRARLDDPYWARRLRAAGHFYRARAAR